MKGYSQAELAERAGLSNGIIGELETGHSNPNLSTIEKIANVLGVHVYQLFFDIDSQHEIEPDSSPAMKKLLIIEILNQLVP